MNALLRAGVPRSAGSWTAPARRIDAAAFGRRPATVRVPGAVDFGGGMRGESAVGPSERQSFNEVLRAGAELVASVNPGPVAIRRRRR
jgi:hypothetical protein